MTQLTASASNVSAFITLRGPRFYKLWKAYSEVGRKKAREVYEYIDGNVGLLYKENPLGYANACALRMSRSFNYGEYPVPSGTIIKTYPIYRERGSDNKAYI